jgi:hypothetical protein
MSVSEATRERLSHERNTCPQCGALFGPKPYMSDASWRGYVYCSRRCAGGANVIPIARRIENLSVRTETGCRVWTGCRTIGGYGQIGVIRNGRQRKLLVHRLMWEITRGAIPAGLDVLHRCDTPPCFEPSHLFLGDDLANNRDKVSKGRQARLKGEANGQARLTEDQVRSIRADTRSQAAIGAEYGISQAQISFIKKGERWKHIQ